MREIIGVGGMINDTAKLLAIKAWCLFMIKNQEELKKEWVPDEFEGYEWPDWNKGYLECLEDLRAILESEE